MTEPITEEKKTKKQAPTEAIASTETGTEAIASPEPPIYSTSWYEANAIPYCKTCGEKYRTGMYGEPLCPIDATDCPRTTNGNPN